MRNFKRKTEKVPLSLIIDAVNNLKRNEGKGIRRTAKLYNIKVTTLFNRYHRLKHLGMLPATFVPPMYHKTVMHDE